MIFCGFARFLKNSCSVASKRICVKPPRKFWTFSEDFEIFWIFWFLTIFGRVVHPNVGGDFGVGRKNRKIMVQRGYGKDINFFLKKVENFSPPVSGAPTRLDQLLPHEVCPKPCQTRFFAQNVDLGFSVVAIPGEKSRFWWILSKLWANRAPWLVNGFA